MTEQHEVDKAEAPKSRWSSLESKISLIALVLSVAAVLTSIIEVTFIREELRSEAWPYISLDTTYNSDGFAITIMNKGVGPAKVRRVELVVDNTSFKDIDQLIIDTVGEENAFSYDLYSMRNPAPGVMSSGEQITLFSVPWEPRTRLFIQNLPGELSVTACYCSIYDDCWLADIKNPDPQPVESCN